MRSTSPASSSGCSTRASAPQTSAAACRAAGDAARSPRRGALAAVILGVRRDGAGRHHAEVCRRPARSAWARGIRARTQRDEQRDAAGGERGGRLLLPDGGRGSEVQAGEGRLGGAQLALERDAGVDGVAVEQIVGVVAQAGAGQVGHAGVEPPRRGDGGAELGERDLGRGRRRGGRRRRLERAGAGDERLEIGGGAVAPEAESWPGAV